MATKTLDIKGGTKLARALSQLATKLGDGTTTLRVGFLEGATYPGGDDRAGLPVATVAFWNEFGTSKAPPRPFFRNAIEQHSPEWGEQLVNALKVAKMNGDAALNIMGTVIKDQIVQSIVDTNAPPLAPSTIAKKGFSKPLIDTGVMQRSVDYTVGKVP